MIHEVVERYGGEVPGTKDGLMSLSGVGDYVRDEAAAVPFRRTVL